MNCRQSVILFFFIFFFSSQIAHCAGIIARVQQNKRMKQQQTQIQYQQYLLGQQGMSQQARPQAQQEPQPVRPPTYVQIIDQRNQAIAQAIVDTHNSAVSVDNQAPSGKPGSVASWLVTQKVVDKEVVDLSEVWRKLDKKSEVWTLLIDDQDKILTVSEYIDRFRKQGVRINKSAWHYVQMIDQIAAQNPQILQKPFGELLETMAIIDYDFDNGVDKDVLAKRILGEAGFEANKKRVF